MHISQKLRDAEAAGKVSYSFEFFPPKTEQGVQNLYDRIDRMHSLGPTFIDVTWGAGGSRSSLTCEMVKMAQSVYGLETCMHLTCTDMGREKIDAALKEAYNSGCTNILALRGDPPREREKWQASEGGFQYARDLVKYIKKTYGDYFDIGVAGYPEGCDDNDDADELIEHLKEKVDAGGTFVITQMSYDADIYADWIKKVRKAGIDVPLIPGIMPIHTHAAFLRRANWTGCRIPPHWTEALEPIKNDDEEVRRVGCKLIAEMCRKMMAAGINHLHFYTMNLAQSTRMVLEELEITPDQETPLEKPLPWRPSLGHNRRSENVRPIFWRNRQRAYVERTQDWDEFPNGRWGDSRSPAFGELDAYDIGLKGSNESNRKKWGEPASIADLSSVFVRYMKGELDSLPWSEQKITSEADTLTRGLIDLNSRGIFTINSQPPVNGVRSDHAEYGWGPKNGFCYQKAYLEVLVSPELIPEVVKRIEADEELTYYAVNKQGDLQTNAPGDGPNAVTWGVFPGKEIVQPTVVETISFLAWKDEFYKLGMDWAHCHDAKSPSRHLLAGVMENWYLVNIVHNDFHVDDGIFPIFNDLSVKNATKPAEPNGEVVGKEKRKDQLDGENQAAPETNGEGVNGVSGINGRANETDGDAQAKIGKTEINGIKQVNRDSHA